MKKTKLVLLMMFAFMAAAIAGNRDSDPSLDFRFANEQVVQEGDTYYFLFDVEVRATVAGTFHRDMQVYFDYNPAVFGTSIKANDKITVEKIGIMAEEFAGNFKYIWVNESIPQGYGTDNTPTRYYITSETNFPGFPPSEMFHTEVPADWAGYMRAKIEISSFGHPAGIRLIGMIGNTTFMDGGQYYQSITAQPVVYAFPYGYMNDLMEYMIVLDTDPFIVSITPVESISVPFGTLLPDAILELPATTTITDSDAQVHVVDLAWTIPTYNANLAGDYEAIATFELPEGVVQSEPETTLEVTTTVTVLEAPVYTLSLFAVPEEGGEVFGAGQYSEGETANVNAVANEGWFFVNWTDLDGNLVSEQPANSITVTEDLTLFANFEEEIVEPEVFSVVLFSFPEEGGFVTGEGEFEAGTEVTVIATPNEGWEFLGWAEQPLQKEFFLSEDPVYTFIMPERDLTLIGGFGPVEVEPETYILTLLVNPEGAGEVFGAGEYEEGEVASVDAVPNEGWVFVNWTDTEDNIISEMPANEIPMTANLTLIANFMEEFVPEIYTLTLLVNPEGAGEVFGAGEYEEGEVASVDAVPNEGWVFVNWTDTEDNIISEMP
ncbi:MAG: hypothetical protein EA361_11190, partial [Bacteroidetes bacterium]